MLQFMAQVQLGAERHSAQHVTPCAFCQCDVMSFPLCLSLLNWLHAATALVVWQQSRQGCKDSAPGMGQARMFPTHTAPKPLLD